MKKQQLPDAVVLDIIAHCRSGKRGAQAAMARKYRVSRQAVSAIMLEVNGKRARKNAGLLFEQVYGVERNG